MKSSLLGASAAVALLASVSAAGAGPSISYVPNSLVQSVIKRGPWTLHESDAPFQHDASGIVPTAPGPPYSGSGELYAGYCNAAGQLAVNP